MTDKKNNIMKLVIDLVEQKTVKNIALIAKIEGKSFDETLRFLLTSGIYSYHYLFEYIENHPEKKLDYDFYDSRSGGKKEKRLWIIDKSPKELKEMEMGK